MYARNIVFMAFAALAAAQDAAITPTPTPTPTDNSGAGAGSLTRSVITTTKVVDSYTTYCPGATSFSMGGKPYVVTAACTLTITDCPCTIVEPCYTCNGGGATTFATMPTGGAIPPVSSGLAPPATGGVVPGESGGGVPPASLIPSATGGSVPPASGTAPPTVSPVSGATSNGVALLLAGLLGVVAL